MINIKIKIFLIICVLFFAKQLSAAQSVNNSQPNIVILFADDMGYGEVQALNPKRGKIPTPNLDKLAQEGIVFSDAHTASSVCTPSRYALLTGRYAWRTRLQRGVLIGHGEPLITEQRLTLPEMLKTKGYNTAISGKWHLNFHYQYQGETLGHPGKKKEQEATPINSYIPDGPLTRGFDHYFGFHHARDMKTLIKDDRVIEHIEVEQMLPRTTAYAVDYINNRAAEAKNGKPFFLYMAFGSPHTPIVPTKEWQGKSGLGEYGDFVMMTDAMAGKIIDAIDENDLTDNTIVIFSSDNGTSKMADIPALERQGHYPSANLRGLKSDLWDGGHRVPFILRWPNGHKSNLAQRDQLIGLSDVMATMADVTNYNLPNDAAEDSISFLSVIEGELELASKREAIVHHSISGKFSIRQGDWKLLIAPGSGGWSVPNDIVAKQNGLPTVQLYNLAEDIGEKQNLANEYPDKVISLIALLQNYVDKGRSTPGSNLKNDTLIDIFKLEN